MTDETVSHPPFLECSANCETILVTASPTAKDIGPLAQTHAVQTPFFYLSTVVYTICCSFSLLRNCQSLCVERSVCLHTMRSWSEFMVFVKRERHTQNSQHSRQSVTFTTIVIILCYILVPMRAWRNQLLLGVKYSLVTSNAAKHYIQPLHERQPPPFPSCSQKYLTGIIIDN